MKKEILKEFMIMPGVGKAVAEDLWKLGYRTMHDLRGEDPEEMYEQLCILQNCHVDKCMKYVFRCCIYYVSNDEHKPELLKWWNWKDK